MIEHVDGLGGDGVGVHGIEEDSPCCFLKKFSKFIHSLEQSVSGEDAPHLRSSSPF
jgi:hypothetical protein